MITKTLNLSIIETALLHTVSKTECTLFTQEVPC
jgi:hypothetical protein